MKLLICLLLCFVAIQADFLSYDRKFSYDINENTIEVVGTPTDGDEDSLEYGLNLEKDGLSISALYYTTSKEEPIVNFNLKFTDLYYKSDDSKSYSTWDWTSFEEVIVTSTETIEVVKGNTTYEEEYEYEDITLVKTLKTVTQDGAFSVLFTLNPKTGNAGVLEVSQNNVVFDIDVDFSKVNEVISAKTSDTFVIKALLQTDHLLGNYSEDSETISHGFSWDDYDAEAASLDVAKIWECDDSTTYTISQTSFEIDENTGDYEYAYVLTWEIEGNFQVSTVCLWDPVLRLNENRTYTATEDETLEGEEKDNTLAVALGVSLSILALIIIIVLVVVLIKRKEENQTYTDYDVR